MRKYWALFIAIYTVIFLYAQLLLTLEVAVLVVAAYVVLSNLSRPIRSHSGQTAGANHIAV